jgi:hypothetical protein
MAAIISACIVLGALEALPVVHRVIRVAISFAWSVVGTVEVTVEVHGLPEAAGPDVASVQLRAICRGTHASSSSELFLPLPCEWSAHSLHSSITSDSLKSLERPFQLLKRVPAAPLLRRSIELSLVHGLPEGILGLPRAAFNSASSMVGALDELRLGLGHSCRVGAFEENGLALSL